MSGLATIAISGGIDSLYSAYLIKQAGYEVEGIHFITGYGPGSDRPVQQKVISHDKVTCHCEADPSVIYSMSLIAEQLGIKIHIIDCSDIFQEKVVDYFIESYQQGKTPSPCMTCNPAIKFGVLMDFAVSLNADFLATGHYARTKTDEMGRVHLYKGTDEAKDQSYFLSLLSQQQLKKARFPLGEKRKSEIIKEAKEAGLSPISEKESQDICFIPDNDYKKFLKNQHGFLSTPGPIKTTDGKQIGEHPGLHSYTIGQRRGINCPGPAPYYVVKLDAETDSLIVGFKDELEATTCKVKGINWINRPEGSEFQLTTRIRYGHKGEDSTINIADDNSAEIIFHKPVSAVTPGQGAVFYSGSEVIGGGWIE